MADGAPKRVRRQGPVRVKRLVAAYPLRRGLVRLRRVKRQLGHAELPISVTRIREAIGRSREATVEGLTPEAALHARHNFRLGVLNGVLFTLVDSLIAPGFALALFVNRLGGSNLL